MVRGFQVGEERILIYHFNRDLLGTLLDLRSIDLSEATLPQLLVNIVVFNTLI